MSEIKKLFDELNTAFDEFKTSNDERLKEIETKGKADPLLEEKVDKANNAITNLETKLTDAQKEVQDRIDKVELDFQQQGLHTGGSKKDIQDEAKEFFNSMGVKDVDVKGYGAYKQAFNSYLRRGERALSTDIRNALSVGSDPDGGQWVPAATTNKIIKKLFDPYETGCINCNNRNRQT